MKTVPQQCFAIASILAIGKSGALTSSVRGGGISNKINSRDDRAQRRSDGHGSFNGVLSRRSLQHVNRRQHAEKSPSKERQTQEEPPSYWWLNKESNEKNIVYESKEGEEISTYSNSLFKTHFEKEKENRLNSLSVYTIDVDNNPDTSGLPYRSPSKKPTERPTSSPTEEVITHAPTALQEVEQYTKQVSETQMLYFYPIWADTFKGCVSSTAPPEAYLSFPSEYIFDALSACCQFWFDSSAECLSSRERSKDDYSITMDEYMFQMNGAEAYSDGDETSKDVNTSLDVPTQSLFSPSPASETSTTVANTMPPAMASLFPTPAGDVTFPPVGVVTSAPTYMPTLGDGVEVPSGGFSPPPTSASSIKYTPYPTFGAIIDPTSPPVTEVTVSTPPSILISGTTSPPYGTGAVLTPLPTNVGSSIATATPVSSTGVPFTPQPTPFGSSTGSIGGTSPPPMMSGETTPWPTFANLTSNPAIAGGAFTPQPTNAATVSGTTAGSNAGTVESTSAGSTAATAISTNAVSSAVTSSGTTAGSNAGTVQSTSAGSTAATAISTNAVSSAGTSSGTTSGTSTTTSTSSIASSSALSNAGTNSSSFISNQNITKLSALVFPDPSQSTPNYVIYSNSFESGSVDRSTSDPYFSWSTEQSSANVSAWEVTSSSDVDSFDGGNFIAQTGLFAGEESAVISLTLTVGIDDSNYNRNTIEVLKNGAYVTFAVDVDVGFPVDSFMFRVDDEVVRSWDSPTDGWELVTAFLPPIKIGEQSTLSWSYGYVGASSSVKSGACKLDAVVVESLTGDLHMFDEQSEQDVSRVLNLHDEDSDFGWKLVEIGEGVAYEGAFSFIASTQQIANGLNAKRLFMSHAKSDLRVLSGDAKMSVTVITGVNGGTLEYAVLSRVSFPLDVLEIGFDGSPMKSITEVSNDWEVHTLELIPGKHTIYFRHIANPKNLPESELDMTHHPDGYEGVSFVDGIRYSDNSPVHPSLFPTTITPYPTIS